MSLDKLWKVLAEEPRPVPLWDALKKAGVPIQETADTIDCEDLRLWFSGPVARWTYKLNKAKRKKLRRLLEEFEQSDVYKHLRLLKSKARDESLEYKTNPALWSFVEELEHARPR
jgi:hypothetical protein